VRREDVAEFDYRPTKCKKTYRMVVVRKNLTPRFGDCDSPDDASGGIAPPAGQKTEGAE